MPYAPPRHNAHRVQQNRNAGQKEYNRTKRKNQAFYDSRAWRKLRAWYVKKYPICVECKFMGRATPVDVVDHIIPVEDGGAPLSEDNLQSLCHLHHNQKTARDKG